MISSMGLGFVTNSSTAVAIVLFSKNKIEVIDSINIKTEIENNFNQFVEKYLPSWNKRFVKDVKKSIPIVFEEIKQKIHDSSSNLIKIEARCDIEGNGYAMNEPKAYAALFIVKYILKDLAIDQKFCKA